MRSKKKTVSVEDVLWFARAASRARPLFGGEVISYLEGTRKTMTRLRLAVAQAQTDDDERRAAAADRAAGLETALTEFYDNLWMLVRPYITMHQKVITGLAATTARLGAPGPVAV
jgi:hypothetical protein